MTTSPNQAQTRTSYNTLPYLFESHYLTHPDRLATTGTLFGMAPAPIERCRVLELGCASGGNLLPMAYNLPASQFTGVDFSEGQIAKAKEMQGFLGLKNVSFFCQNLMDLDAGIGPFDYIIAHGLFSWIPLEVQTKIFEICQKMLAPQGLAYISYNTLPGWALRQELRQFMLYHVRGETQTQPRLHKAIESLDFITKNASETPEKSFTGYLMETIHSMKEWTNKEEDLRYWYHEYLEEYNTPMHFHEVVEMAQASHLRYVAEADDSMMYHLEDYSPEANAFFDEARDRIEQEQILDYLTNRMFRRSLFCHEEVSLLEHPGPEQISKLSFDFKLKPAESSPEDGDNSVLHFVAGESVDIPISHPLEKAVLLYLHRQHPRFVPFGELVKAVAQELPAEASQDPFQQEISRILYAHHLRSSRIVEMSTWLPPYQNRVSPRPQANLVSRLQASLGGIISNQRHESIKMQEQSRYLLWCLNGERDRAEIMALLETAVKDGKLHFIKDEDDQHLTELHDQLEADLDRQLRHFADIYLLIG